MRTISRRVALASLVCTALLLGGWACKGKPPCGPTEPCPPPEPPSTPSIQLVVGTTAKGWSSISVRVDDVLIGTLTKPVEQAVGCDAIPGQQLRTLVAPGAHIVTATGEPNNNLTRWNYSTIVPSLSSGCWAVTLSCPDGDCSPTSTISAPVPSSPTGGQQISGVRPTLSVTNAATTGNVGAITYRFELSELASFAIGSRTDTQEGVAQANGGITGWQVNHDLVRNIVYYWRVRATNGTITSDWTRVETFRTPDTSPTPPAPTPPAPTPPAPTPPAPTPPAPPPPSIMTFEMRNACSQRIDFKFYDRANNLVWPSANTHYEMSAGSSRAVSLNCKTGANVCFGATSADRSQYWGVGVNGDHGCENCCATCSDRRVTPAALSCGSAPAPAPLPAAQCRANSSGSVSWTVQNDTPYTLRISFVGPVSRTVTVSANGSETVALSAGQYRITAEALNAPNVQGFAGDVTASSSCDYLQTFYLQR
jgi:hypothetical protein